MNLILFDENKSRGYLKPLTQTRPISDLRLGIYTIAEKWTLRTKANVSYLTEEYLAGKFPINYSTDNYYVLGGTLPDESLVKAVLSLQSNHALVHSDRVIAYRSSEALAYPLVLTDVDQKIEYKEKISVISELPHLFLYNGEEIVRDCELIDWGKSGQNPDRHTVTYGEENIYWGENVNVKAAILNAEAGPIFIDDNATIKEGAVITGPAVVGKNAMVGLGANIREFTTIGPFCRVAGEVKNTVFHSYSNKAHEGFLGNAYVGSVCNMGANTNSSNLKNNMKPVSIYNYHLKDFYDTGEKYCGSFIGDYSKTGISTMLNTGTVLGVSANVFGAGYQQKFVPDFGWGGPDKYTAYIFEKALEAIDATLKGFNKELSDGDVKILKHISEES